MYFIKEQAFFTYEEKKSKFIAYISPYSEFKILLSTLKQQHPKARHFVYAYRYLNDFDQIVQNSSDDGEPKGTSGKPTLSALAGAKLINCGVITVRYFGGVKLGTGGLVRAYAQACNEVINISQILPFYKQNYYHCFVLYHLFSSIEYTLKSLEIDVKKDFTDTGVNLELLCTKEKYAEFKNKHQREVTEI